MLMITTSLIAAGNQTLFKETTAKSYIPEKRMPNLLVNDTWMKTFGGLREDCGYHVDQTSDGGYVIVGTKMLSGTRSNDVLLLKTDSTGILTWDKTFGGDYTDQGNSVQQTDDGGYIIVGIHGYHAGNTGDLWLIKTDESGTMLWNQTFDEGIVENGFSVQQTSDDGFIILGETWNATSNYSAVCIIKTDDAGNKLWETKYEDGRFFSGFSILETPQQEYIGVGTKNYDIWAFKVDTDGTKLWDNTYGGNMGYSIAITPEDTYIVVGNTFPSEGKQFDIQLLCLSAMGETLKNMTIGGKLTAETGYSVEVTQDGGCIIAGVKSLFTISKGYLVKLDNTFTVEWAKTFGKGFHSGLISVDQDTDASYILTGFTTKFYFNANVLLIKTT